MKNMKWIFSMLVMVCLTDCMAQTADSPLKGLRKAGEGDLDPDKPMMLDPHSMPMYFEDLSKVEEQDFMSAMMSGQYMPEPYVDSTKEVRAIVLRKATEEEKARLKEMQAGGPGDDEYRQDLMGKEARPFSVTDLQGNKFTLEELKGKVIVINFWFVECKPCVMEIPELNKLVEKFAGKDVVFLAFSTSDKSKIERLFKTQSYNYHVVPDCKDVAETYSVRLFPTHMIIDKNSIIAYCVSGVGPNTISNIDQTIGLLLK